MESHRNIEQCKEDCLDEYNSTFGECVAVHIWLDQTSNVTRCEKILDFNLIFDENYITKGKLRDLRVDNGNEPFVPSNDDSITVYTAIKQCSFSCKYAC